MARIVATGAKAIPTTHLINSALSSAMEVLTSAVGFGSSVAKSGFSTAKSDFVATSVRSISCALCPLPS